MIFKRKPTVLLFYFHKTIVITIFLQMYFNIEFMSNLI